MLACEQCDGCATCEVETDNFRCVCSGLWVAKVTQCGRCCLLLHALKLPQKLAVRCCRWWRRGKMRTRRSSRRSGRGLFLLAGSARFERMQMLQHIMLLLLLLLRVLIKPPLLHHVALSLLLPELLVRLFSYAAASAAAAAAAIAAAAAAASAATPQSHCCRRRAAVAATETRLKPECSSGVRTRRDLEPF